jgi:hypothetical protein
MFTTCDSDDPGGDDHILDLGGAGLIMGGPGDDILTAQSFDGFMVGDQGTFTRLGGQPVLITCTAAVGGNDILTVTSGNPLMLGGGGSDILTGGPGRSIMLGDNGLIRLNRNDGLASVQTLGSDTDDDDQLFGGDGNDVLLGGSGSDTVSGGEGDDWIFGDGARILFRADGGLAGVESLDQAGNGSDHLAGEGGDDLLVGGSGDDHLSGGDGADILFGDHARGEAGPGLWPVITRIQSSQMLIGGRDTLSGGSGHDVLVGGAGDDTLGGDTGEDQLFGDDAGLETTVDALFTVMDETDASGHDSLSGGEGNDRMFGGGGDDRISGDVGDNQMSGGRGNDHMTGGTGNDRIDGGEGDDLLFGLDGDDTFIGSTGRDVLDGGPGRDEVLGLVDGNRLVDVEVLKDSEGNDLLPDPALLYAIREAAMNVEPFAPGLPASAESLFQASSVAGTTSDRLRLVPTPAAAPLTVTAQRPVAEQSIAEPVRPQPKQTPEAPADEEPETEKPMRVFTLDDQAMEDLSQLIEDFSIDQSDEPSIFNLWLRQWLEDSLGTMTDEEYQALLHWLVQQRQESLDQPEKTKKEKTKEHVDTYLRDMLLKKSKP